MARLLTAEQAAAFLNCSPRTVRRLVANGELRAVRVGTLLRISEAALTDWQAAHETSTAAPSSAAAVSRPVARPVGTPALYALPADYAPVFNPDGSLAQPAARPAAARGRSTHRTKKRA